MHRQGSLLAESCGSLVLRPVWASSGAPITAADGQRCATGHGVPSAASVAQACGAGATPRPTCGSAAEPAGEPWEGRGAGGAWAAGAAGQAQRRRGGAGARHAALGPAGSGRGAGPGVYSAADARRATATRRWCLLSKHAYHNTLSFYIFLLKTSQLPPALLQLAAIGRCCRWQVLFAAGGRIGCGFDLIEVIAARLYLRLMPRNWV